MKKTQVLMITILLTILGCKDKENLKKLPKTSEFINQHVTSFLVRNNLERLHFKKSVDPKEFVPSYLSVIDPNNSVLLEEQISKLQLEQMFVDLDKNISTIAALSKKSIDSNLEIINSSLTNHKVSFESLNKNKNKLTVDREDSPPFKTNVELSEYWTSLLEYNTILKYIDLLNEKENKGAKKDDSSKKEKIKFLKSLSYDDELLKKAHSKSLTKLKRMQENIIEKTVDDYVADILNAIANVYDIHSSYIPPVDLEDFNMDLNGKMEGIGAVLSEEDGEITVVSVIPGGAAWKSDKIEADDIFVKITEDNKSTNLSGMSVSDAVKLIRGPKNKNLTITIKKAKTSEIVDVPLSRDVIEIASTFVKYSTIKLNNKKYGYIYVPKFYRDFNDRNSRNSADDVKKALIDFKNSNVSNVILDLRNNGGGALTDAKRMSGLFFDSGPVVNIKDSEGSITPLYDLDNKTYFSGNLVVLVNKFSASASEIVAAALQDHNRAIVIGSDQTHGKGTVQSILPLSSDTIPFLPYINKLKKNLGALKITTQKFYRISGETTQYNGVVPDIVVPEGQNYNETLERNQKYSLKPDRIRKDKYTPFLIENKTGLIKKIQSEIDENKYFLDIKNMRDFLDKNKDKKTVSTNLDKNFYKMKEISDTLDSFNKNLEQFQQKYDINIEPLQFFPNIKNLNTEDEKFKKEYSKKLKEYKEDLEKDLVIHEAIKTLNLMKTSKN